MLSRSSVVRAIDGVEGLIEQNELCVLQEYAGKQGTLQLACGEGTDGPLLEPWIDLRRPGHHAPEVTPGRRCGLLHARVARHRVIRGRDS